MSNDNEFGVPELKHLSPSTISAFIENRSQWYLQKIKNVLPFNRNHAMARGTGVEAGIQHYLASEEKDLAASIAHALGEYTAASVGCPDNLDIRQSIGPCVKAGITELSQLDGIPNYQAEIRTKIAGVKRDIYGKLDFDYPNVIIDTKVVSKTPSELKQAYQIQGALYKKATGKRVIFLFIIPLKKEVKVLNIELSDNDYAYGLQLAQHAGMAIEFIYDNLSNMDGRLLDAVFFPNPSALYGDEAGVILGKFGL